MRRPGRHPRPRRAAGVLAAVVLTACGGDPPAPGASAEAPLDPAAPAVQPVADPTPLQGLRYEVEPGDTLWEVAERHGTTPEAIERASGLTDPDRLDVGDVLTIPPSGPWPAATEPVEG